MYSNGKRKESITEVTSKKSVNPQGLSEDVAVMQPKSQLEQGAKKKNTKN